MLCMCEVYQLKPPSSFSESGLLTYDGPPDEYQGGKAENMFLTPIFTNQTLPPLFYSTKIGELVRRGNRKNKQTLSVRKTLGSDCGQC